MQTVTSKDGTKIAYDKAGSGPAVILVDGAGSFRKFGTAFFLPPLLSKRFTVYSYDRRGRGDSGDTQPYAIEREVEDLQAMMNAVGGPAYVYGHSSGAALTMYAIASGLKPTKVILYEPPFVVVNKGDEHPPTDAMQQLKSRIEAGKPAEAMSYWMTKIISMPGFVVLMLKLFMHKHWKNMVSVAHTLTNDLTIVEKSDWSVPTDIAAKITMPCIVMGGEKSPQKLQNAVAAVGAAIPGAEVKLLPGVTHNVTAKDLLPVMQEYFK